MRILKTIMLIAIIGLFLYIIGALTINNGKITISTAAVSDFAEDTSDLIREIKNQTENSSVKDIAKNQFNKVGKITS